jgi:predicted transcriptional regulator
MNNYTAYELYSVSYARSLTTATSKITAPDAQCAGQYAEDLNALYEMHIAEGPAAAIRVWEKILEAHPALAGWQDRLQKSPLYHASQLNQLPRVTYLYGKEIPEGGLVALYGPSNVGKTFVALDYALWISRSHTVVYVAAESPQGYAKRVAAWCKKHQVEPTALDFYLYGAPVNILDQGAVAALIEAIRFLGPSLVVFDTLARCMVGGDENSSRDMSTFIEGCDQIRHELGATVLVLHHTGKTATSGERGHSSFRGACDVMLEVKNGGGVIELSCGKTKDDEPFPPRYLKLEVIELEEGETSCVVVPSSRTAAIEGEYLTDTQWHILETLMLAVFSESGAKKIDIERNLDIKNSTLYRALSQLKAAGYVSQGKRGEPFKLTQKGREALQKRDEQINAQAGR